YIGREGRASLGGLGGTRRRLARGTAVGVDGAAEPRVDDGLVGHHLARKQLGAVSPVLLSGVKRTVGVAEQAGRVARMVGEDGDSDARRDRALDRWDGYRGERTANVLGNELRGVEPGVGQEDQELLTAGAPDEIALAA